ncbi:MAG: LptF/LptG family permease [Planctomycetota bacterium]|jgi:lipopolysaccharide export LptBFGC system permease protein LptF
MILTLHRYIFRELLRAFASATIALTLMVSIGLLVPIIQDYGVSPGQIIHLLGYFIPITLTFVLPIAALFSGSLVYGRFAADRELDACRASGVSMWTLIYPGLTLAILVSVANLLLSFYVAPAFIHRSEKSVKANAEQILFRNIQKKGSYSLPGSQYQLYADQAVPEKNILEGVVIIDGRKGGQSKVYTAEVAKVEIQTHDTYNEARISAQNIFRFDEIAAVSLETFSLSTQFPPLMRDDVKFQKIEQLKRIQADKMQYYPIRQMAMETRDQLATELLAEDINRRMIADSEGYYQLQDADDNQKLYSLGAGGAEVDPDYSNQIKLTAPIRLIQSHGVRETYIQFDSESGFIAVDNSGTNIRFELHLESPAWQRAGLKPQLSVHQYFPNIKPPAHIVAPLAMTNILATIQTIGTEKSILDMPPSRHLNKYLHRWPTELLSVERDIAAELHSRLVFGLGCVALILMGIALGIQMRGGHVLSAFGASAIPGGILTTFIVSGKALTNNPSTPMITGVTIMWTGLAVLILIVPLVYRKLMRT